MDDVKEQRSGRAAAALAMFATAAALSAGPACVGDTLTEEERATLQALRLPRVLPPSPTNAVADDPVAAALGQQFFFDTRFSGPLLEASDPASGGLGAAGATGKVACATCHDPARGGADPRGAATSLASAWTTRNSPSVINSTHARWLFWDGRKDSLWSQALGPVENASEHNSSRAAVARVIFDNYRAPYEKLFGALPPLDDSRRFPGEGRPGVPAFDGMAPDDRLAVNRVFANFGKVIEAYERLLSDRGSPFDRFLDGDDLAMSAGAIRGAKLFVGRAACNECHSGPMMSDNRFHNHGVPQIGTKVPTIDRGRADAIDKVLADEFNTLGLYSDFTSGQLLAGLTPTTDDLGAFKTPTLRNVSRTGPYMHTGGFASLWEVMVWYNEAAGTDRFAGRRAPASEVPLHLTDEDLNDLVELMRAFEGDPLPQELLTPPALP